MYTILELDRPRKLRFGFKAIHLIEQKFGKTFYKIDFNDLNSEQLATVLWGAMYQDDNDLTIEKTIELLDEYANHPTATKAMNDGFNLSFGIENDNEGK